MEPGSEERKKKVDEAWKDAVQKERSQDESAQGAGAEYPREANFALFLSGLMLEGLMALGELENPLTKKKEVNLEQARYIIDIISVLKEKTKNNLNKEEEVAMDQMLYELRTRYIAKVNAKG